MNELKLLKDLRECTGIDYTSCRTAIVYCKMHPDCSPLGYLDALYSGVKYSNLDKAIKDASLRLEYNPPHWTQDTEIYIPFNKLYGLPPINKDSFAEVIIKYD